MDDTQQSRISDTAATRKRRSSILKSQRPPRAPFSELEFNVTTPTDTAKSRRVSFSRRTGVAEFVTNEATTTWKNFYEEHNKTLESSGNESVVNAPRASAVGHLGKRIFEDQFQEVEIIDYGSNTDLTKVEYNNTDITADGNKLTVPQQHFELSALTATGSKLFEDNLGISRIGEITDNINVNFSVMQPIGDDLDEIQKDIERHAHNAANVVCAGPSDRNLSGYIEVDLNATHCADADAASDDMSITDTINSPKVNVSKSNNVEPKDNKDWVADKENIVVNPYIAPKESSNFAVNEESDKVLVFDGKRLTIQSQNEPLSDYRKTLLPNSQPEKTPQRKTIVLNVDDDLPNFVPNPHASMSQHSKNFSLDNTAPEDSDISMTQPIEAKISTNAEQNQSVCKNSSMRISSSALLNGNGQKRQTIVFESDDADISVTKAVASAGILNPALLCEEQGNKRKTIIFEDDAADVSMTEALSANFNFYISESGQKFPVKRRTIVYETEGGNISVSEMVSPPASKPPKRNTIVFDESDGNISLTQAIPSNLIMSETELSSTHPASAPVAGSAKRKTIVFNDSDGNISLTQAIPSNLIVPELSSTCPESAPVAGSAKRKTIVFNDSDGNISLTQAIPSNLIVPELSSTCPASAPVAGSAKRKTIVFNDSDGNISLTQAIPSNLIVPELSSTCPASAPVAGSAKRKTIVFNDSDGNISFTQAIPSNLIVPELFSTCPASAPVAGSAKRKTIVFNDSDGNISLTEAIPSNLIVPELSSTCSASAPVAGSAKRKTIVFNDSDGNISLTQAIPSNLIMSETELSSNHPASAPVSGSAKRKTIVFNESDGNISLTQAIPSNLIVPETELSSSRRASEVVTESAKRKTIVFNESDENISFTQALIPLNLLPDATMSLKRIVSAPVSDTGKRKTIVFNESAGNISHTQAIPLNLIIPEAEADTSLTKMVYRRHTVNFNESDGNISLTQAIPSNLILPESHLSFKEVSLGKCVTPEKTSNYQPVLRNPNSSENKIENVDISMTQSSSTKVITSKTTAVDDSDLFNMSVTHAILSNVILDNKDDAKSILLEDGHDLVSQVAPCTISSKQPKSEIESLTANMSVTEGTSANLILPKTKQKDGTVNESDKDFSGIFLTEEVPTNILSDKQAAAPILKSESETSASSSHTTVQVSHKNSDQTVSKLDSEDVIEKIDSIKPMDISKKVLALSPKLSPSHKNASHPIPFNLISLQKDMDDLKKLKVDEFIEETELVSNFIVYQTAASNAINPRNIEVRREDSSSIESDTTTESLSAANEHDRTLKAISESATSCSSDAAIENRTSSKDSSPGKLETAHVGLKFVVEVPEPSISSPVNKSCSNMNLCVASNFENLKAGSNTRAQSGILNNLLDMNDSCVSSNDIIEKSVSNQVDVKTPDTSASAETMFIITRDDEGIQTQPDDGDLVLKQDCNSATKREKVCGTSQRNNRRSVADSTADLLELISRLAEKGDEVVKPKERGERQSRGGATAMRRQSVVLSREDLMTNISMAQAMLQNASGPDMSSDESSSPERESPEVVKVLRFEDDDADEATDSVDKVMVSPLKKTAFGESSYMFEEMKKNRVIPTYLKDVSDGIKALMTDLLKPMSDELPFEVATGPRPVSRNRHVQTSRNTSRVSIDTDAEGVTSPNRKLKGIIKKSEDYDRHNVRSPEVVTSNLSVGAAWRDGANNEDNAQNPPTLIFDPDNPLNNVLIQPLNFGHAHMYSSDISRESSAQYECESHLVQRSSMIVRFQTSEEVAHRGVEVNASTNHNASFIPNLPIGDKNPDPKSSSSPEPVARKDDTESRPATAHAGVGTAPKEFKSQQVNTVIAMQDNNSLLLETSSLTLVDSCLGTNAAPCDSLEHAHSPLKMIYKQAPYKMDDLSDIEDKIDEKAFKRKYSGRTDAHELCTLDHIPSPEAKLARKSLFVVNVDENVASDIFEKEGSMQTRCKTSPVPSGRKSFESHRGSSQPTAKKATSPRHRSDTDTKERQMSPSKGLLKERRSPGGKKEKRSPKKSKQFVSQKPNTNVMVQFSMMGAGPETSAREDLSRPGSNLLFNEAGYLIGRRSDTSGSKGDDQSLSSDLAQGRGGYPLDWQPELINELSSKNLVTERENDVDVCETILNLPFMESSDCRWEYCSVEEWRFLLLHGRVRLRAALRPSPARPDVADPAHVRADTPVAHIRLEATPADVKKGSTGVLCVRFAMESMRVVIGREWSRAGEVPALLRRCAAVSRVAARWGRAMHHAWLHLAYSLTEDGFLSLKVANFPLRSVWEVTMNIEMRQASPREVPWPRATNVRVVSVVSSTRLEHTELQRALTALKEDWGHVPRTLWKVFKYLKKKNQIDTDLRHETTK